MAPDGVPARTQRSGSCGERRKGPADMELSPPGGSGMEQVSFDVGAGNEARTRYLHLGKVALYQMSYARRSMTVYLMR